MLLHVFTAAVLLSWGTMFSPVQTNDQFSVNAQSYAMFVAAEEEIPQACLDQLWDEAAEEWNTTSDILANEYIAGLISVNEIRLDTYKASRGGNVYISICSGGE